VHGRCETRALKQAVRRNLDPFPANFMFELSVAEIKNLVSQTVIPARGKFDIPIWKIKGWAELITMTSSRFGNCKEEPDER
jgi:ORF6N domain-containing protein